jgi:hypothetical protein
MNRAIKIIAPSAYPRSSEVEGSIISDLHRFDQRQITFKECRHDVQSPFNITSQETPFRLFSPFDLTCPFLTLNTPRSLPCQL